MDGLAEHCGEEKRNGLGWRLPRSHVPPPPGAPNSPFTLPPVTKHFMLPPAPRSGLASDRAGSGGWPAPSPTQPARGSGPGLTSRRQAARCSLPAHRPSEAPPPPSHWSTRRRLRHVRKRSGAPPSRDGVHGEGRAAVTGAGSAGPRPFRASGAPAGLAGPRRLRTWTPRALSPRREAASTCAGEPSWVASYRCSWAPVWTWGRAGASRGRRQQPPALTR